MKEPLREERDSSLPTTVSPEPFADNHDSPQAKMKHYIRDIMGEQLPEKKQGE